MSSSPYQPPTSGRGRLWKNLVWVLIIGLFFTIGVIAGRGSLSFAGHSLAPSSKAPTAQLDYSSVNQIYGLLKNNFDGSLDNSKLLDGLKSGLVAAAGDPYTEYFSAQDAKSFNEQLSGSFTGIGAELGSDTSNNIVIVSPLADTPAAKAGLQPKDIVASVNNQSTAGMSVDQVVTKIRGPAGSNVTLTIVRGDKKPFDVTITRSTITVPSVQSSIQGGIGYIKITQFTNDTVQLAQKAADDFESKGVKAVILDLRGNPGGYLQGAVNVSSLWLDQGKTVVSERKAGRTVDTETATGTNPLKGLPTVVLIDGGSASASEITAGALHDNGVATLVGAKSFGKGSVQEVDNLPGGSEVKITVAHWYTPDGKNINKEGITPDVSVSISDADRTAGRDPQKDKATQILQSKIQ